jgi:hypothetical protein
MSWNAHLAHDHDIERRVEGIGDGVGDHDATARQPEHERPRRSQMFEALAEATPGVTTVGEDGQRP